MVGEDFHFNLTGKEPEADQEHRRVGVRSRRRDDRHALLCQANVEIHQGEINKKYGTKFNMPVTYYSQLMTLAYGGGIEQAWRSPAGVR
jgi:trehalose-6-phosphate synthase